MENESDAAVIAASFDDPGRFGAIFDRHATVVFRYLVRRVGVNDAEPLLGDVFRVAFEKRESYDCERANARPWLYGIATNLLAHHRRTEARRMGATARLLARRPSGGDRTDEIDERLDAEDLWPHVAEAVAALPEGERAALLLYVWEELSYEEIARALDVPLGTVRSRLNRARVPTGRDPRGTYRDRGIDARVAARRRRGRDDRARERRRSPDPQPAHDRQHHRAVDGVT